MNPIQSSEMIRIVHDQMLRDYARHQRLSQVDREPGHAVSTTRRAAARFLVALGTRLDPGSRGVPALPVPGAEPVRQSHSAA